MAQRTQTNPSLTLFKKPATLLTATHNQISPRLFKKPQQSFVTLGRDTTSIKLPTLYKKTPSSSKIFNT